MKTIRLFVFAILNMLILDVSVCLVFATAPTTAKILFTSSRDGNYEVYIMNPDGSEQVNLTQHRANDLNAVWSPTGEEILFVSDREGGIRDLYLMDPSGSNVRPVFTRKRTSYRDSPTWSPDGKQIAYTHLNWNGVRFHIHVTTLGSQKEEGIVEGRYPTWSPDGTKIAYMSYIGDTCRVVLIDIHTRRQKHLLPRTATSWQNHPFWSATERKIVFSWNKNPLPRLLPGDRFPAVWLDKETIYIVNRDGTDLRELLNEAGPRAQYPVLSPDGEEVLYTQKINGRLHIFKLDVNSGTRTQLTHIGRVFDANFRGDWFDPMYLLSVSPQSQLLSTVWGKIKKK